MQSADGIGAIDRLMTSTNSQWPTAATPDGTAIIGFQLGRGEGRGDRVIVWPLATPASGVRPAVSPRGEPIVESLFEGNHADISPDGRYLAYQAISESGRNEVYVRPFPGVNKGRWQISTTGGTRPVWARSGRELFYIDESMTLNRVPIRSSGSTFRTGSPAKVFDTIYAQPSPARHYDVSSDGQRFLMVKDNGPGDPTATPASMIVVEHWFAELKQRVSPREK
jgi:serine/threonine-protein kinase